MYTEDQVWNYCQVLCFSATLELFKELKIKDNKLANEVSDFNITLTLLEAIDTLEQKQTLPISYLGLKEHLLKEIFKGQVDSVELEEKLGKLLPSLQENGLMENMKITAEGKKILQIKKTVFHLHSSTSSVPN